MILAPIAGRLADRYIPQILAAIGMALGTISLILFSFLDKGTSLEFLIGSMVIYGVAFGLFSPPNTSFSRFSFSGNHAYRRPGNEHGAFDTGFRIRDGGRAYNS